jgi:hypothetical protein
VGRDQIHFWAINKDEKLDYYDVFIRAEDEQDGHGEDKVELTACDYLSYQDSHYLLCGTSNGELVIVRYGDFKIVWRKIVCSGEIMNLKCYQNRTVIGSSDGNLYFWNHTTNVLQTEPNPSFVRLNLYYSVNSIFFDDEGT